MTRKKNLNAKMDNALTRITSVMEISTARINLMRVFSFALVSLIIKFSFHEFKWQFYNLHAYIVKTEYHKRRQKNVHDF